MNQILGSGATVAADAHPPNRESGLPRLSPRAAVSPPFLSHSKYRWLMGPLWPWFEATNINYKRHKMANNINDSIVTINIDYYTNKGQGSHQTIEIRTNKHQHDTQMLGQKSL